ncbi:hypothetical protein MMC25_007815 [Agyrium rufum]|nr:hypothetical protein [Agyrium rufum]
MATESTEPTTNGTNHEHSQASSPNRIVQLSTLIAEKTKLIDKFLTAQNLPTPSFEVDQPSTPPYTAETAPEIEAARISIVEATAELRALMLGPQASLRINYTENISLHAISRFDIASSFPVGEEATYAEIAAKTGIEEKNLQRLLRHGMVNHLFREPRKGVVTHTSLTRWLAEDENLHGFVETALSELMPAAMKTADALEKFPHSEEVTHTGFSLANNTSEKSMWDLFTENPERGKKFGKAMSMMSSVKGYDPRYLLDGYPWKEIVGNEGTVVDVGGSHGSVAISIAQEYPQIKCVVQDLAGPVKEGKAKLPEELKGRVSFMAHNFMDPQPVKDADVYYFRWIFHNWSNKYCINILQNLIPSLKPGARILIQEVVLPEPGTLPIHEERIVRNMDVVMLMLLNAQERDKDQFANLFRMADPRFKYLGIRKCEGATLSMIEASWEP